MKSKKSWRLSGGILIVLILAGVVIWGIFTRIDRTSLRGTIADTIYFAKI